MHHARAPVASPPCSRHASRNPTKPQMRITTAQLIGNSTPAGDSPEGASNSPSPIKSNATAVLATAATAEKSPLAEGGASSSDMLGKLR